MVLENIKAADDFTVRHQPPATYVHTAPGEVTRIDTLTLEQARAVIVNLCDRLEGCGLEILELHKKLNRANGRRH